MSCWRKTAMACGLGLPVGCDPAENALNALPPRWRKTPSAIKERAELPVHKNNKLIGIVVATTLGQAIYILNAATLQS
jgi:hypothetical protein